VVGYADVLANLGDPARAQKGLCQLDSMVERGDAEATYLKSRLYFRSKATTDYRPDSIKKMQKATGLKPDNKRAHELLLKTVQLRPDDYRALYELGCDYLGGESRTDAVGRDIEKADGYFAEALKAAEKARDDDFTRMIVEQMAKYK